MSEDKTRAMSERPTRDQIDNACMWHMHDFGLLSEVDKDKRRYMMTEYWKAIYKSLCQPDYDFYAKLILQAGAQSGDEGTFKLAAQLAGCPACDGCGYIKNHCKCVL
jgi:hypothetical protein